MQLEVDLDRAERPVLTGLDDFRNVAVVLTGTPDRARASAVLAGWGDLDGDHVWLHIGILEKRIAGRADRPSDWLEQFAAMIECAESQGRLDDGFERVRAHCEWMDA